MAFLGSRSCFFAGIAFVITAVVAFPLAVRIGLAQVSEIGAGGTALLQGIVMLAVTAVLLPALAALVVAHFVRDLRPPSAFSYARNLVTWLIAALSLPVILVLYLRTGAEHQVRASAEALSYKSRPIGFTDSLGFCAPPIYASEGGIPTVTLTARLPRDDHYAWYFEGADSAGTTLRGFQQGDFVSGIQTVKLVANPEPDKTLHIDWPVTIREIRVYPLHDTPPPPDEWSDSRFSEHLAVIPGP